MLGSGVYSSWWNSRFRQLGSWLVGWFVVWLVVILSSFETWVFMWLGLVRLGAGQTILNLYEIQDWKDEVSTCHKLFHILTMIYITRHQPSMAGKWRSQWVPMGQKLWSIQRYFTAQTALPVFVHIAQLKVPHLPPMHSSCPRIWGTLPEIGQLRRPLDVKQLRESLARTGLGGNPAEYCNYWIVCVTGF